MPGDNTVVPIVNNVSNLVNTGFATAQSFASEARNDATAFLDQIAEVAAGLAEIPPISEELLPVESAITDYAQPPEPEEPDGLAMNLPPAPTPETVTAVQALDLEPIPEFTASQLPITMPAVPSALAATVPLMPALATATTPVEPTITLPDVPTLTSVNIPPAPTLSMPSFSATLGTAPIAPANTFSFTDSTYTSDLLTSITATLQAWTEGTFTGIDPGVEAQNWNRGRARTSVARARAAGEAVRELASRGFRKPPGAMAIALKEAAQESLSADLGASSEIAIEQAKLEQSNRRFAMEQGLKVESELLGFANSIAQRSFESSKFAAQIAVEIFQAEVQKYAGEVQAYDTRAKVLKTLIEAELSKLEVFRSELEGQKLIGELNVQQVEIYRARVAAAESLVSIFKSRIDAANLTLQGNKILIDGFGAQVGAYEATVRSKASEYDMYANRLKGEALKVDIFRGQADVYGRRVDAFKVGTDARVAAKQIEIEVNQKLPLENYRINAEVYKTLSEGEGTRVNALNKVFETRAGVFGEMVKGEAARLNAETGVYKASADVAVAEGQLRIQAATANIQRLFKQVELLVESIKAGAQVSAQIAASALSGVNLSAGLSASGSAATNYGQSDSWDNTKGVATYSNSFDMTKGVETTSTNYNYNRTGTIT
jgi:hypothetical protein